jgi:transcriptional regulator with XRE-family HTH domain
VRKAPTERRLRLSTRETARVLAERLAELRATHDWSQDDLARRAGVDRKTVNRIEKGHFSPSLDTLVRLSIALDRGLTDLLDD